VSTLNLSRKKKSIESVEEDRWGRPILKRKRFFKIEDDYDHELKKVSK